MVLTPQFPLQQPWRRGEPSAANSHTARVETTRWRFWSSASSSFCNWNEDRRCEMEACFAGCCFLFFLFFSLFFPRLSCQLRSSTWFEAFQFAGYINIKGKRDARLNSTRFQFQWGTLLTAYRCILDHLYASLHTACSHRFFFSGFAVWWQYEHFRFLIEFCDDVTTCSLGMMRSAFDPDIRRLHVHQAERTDM